jgi:hypothetical protein
MIKLFSNFLFKNNNTAYIILFLLSFIIVCITIYNNFFNKKPVVEPFWDAIEDAVESAIDAVISPIVDAVESVIKVFTDIIDWIAGIPDMIMDIIDDIVEALESILDALKGLIMDVIDGIDDMITNFERLICLFQSFPVRAQNILHGFNNIFIGIGEQIELFIQAGEMGFKETSSYAKLSGIYTYNYIQCLFKFLRNSYKCFFYYILDLIGKILYIPFSLLFWLSKNLFGIDLYPLETRLWKSLELINNFVFSIVGFHIIHFPQKVREDCYSCIRLSGNTLKKQGHVVSRTFNKDIPELISGNITKVGIVKMRKGIRHWDEVLATNPREPNKVE